MNLYSLLMNFVFLTMEESFKNHTKNFPQGASPKAESQNVFLD